MTGRTTLLVATGNPGKLREYEELLRDAPFRLVSLKDLGITSEVDETGETFAENAWLKASGYAAMSGMLTLADDSGLEVDSLGSDPGVHSARYGGEACRTDADRVDLLLRNLDGIPWERRTARFRCVVNVARPAADAAPLPELLVSVVGSVAGMVQYEPAGNDGFGYDPRGLSSLLRSYRGPVVARGKEPYQPPGERRRTGDGLTGEGTPSITLNRP